MTSGCDWVVRRATTKDALGMAAVGGNADSLELYLLLETTRAYVIEIDTIVGWGITRLIEPKGESIETAPAGWYLLGLVVRPDMQRRGFGKALTEARMEWLSERIDVVRYFTTPDNLSSIRLHESLGFKMVRSGLTPESLAFDGGPSSLYEFQFSESEAP